MLFYVIGKCLCFTNQRMLVKRQKDLEKKIARSCCTMPTNLKNAKSSPEKENIMKDILDLHTHTLASGHAYSTMKEMAETAKEKGISLLGITEHSMKMPGTCHEFYFQNLKAVERSLCGVELLLGVELNIINFDGKVDMKESLLKQMDIAIASFHIPCIAPGTIEENTNAAIKVMQNPYISILGHPDDGRFPFDYERLVKAAKDTHTILEINNSSLSPKSFRPNARENDKILLEWCKKLEVFVIMDSDAHTASAVGNHENSFSLLKEIDFPEKLIVNDKPEWIKNKILEKRSGL